jgi:hypothetical protein
MTSAHGSVAAKSSVGWLARCGAPRSPEVSGKITVYVRSTTNFVVQPTKQ